jgi:hypothetical protein
MTTIIPNLDPNEDPTSPRRPIRRKACPPSMRQDPHHGSGAALPTISLLDVDAMHLCTTSSCRIVAPRPSPRICQRVSATLATVSPHFRSLICKAYRQLGGRRGRLNDHRRALLSEAIFQIENDLEHRQAKHAQVAILRAIRNHLYDDLGWNESRQATAHLETSHAA